jgi:ElaA protein
VTEPNIETHFAHINEMSVEDIYMCLKLRVDIFVVEQHCAYAELDMRDLEPGTVHAWASQGGSIVSYLRIMEQPDDGAWIGRVCTAYDARSKGIARRLMDEALGRTGHRAVDIHAQSHLVPWYETFGFIVCGPPFFEVGQPHTPMRREPTNS